MEMSNVQDRPKKKCPDMWWWLGKDLAPFFAAVARRGSDNVVVVFDGKNIWIRSALAKLEAVTLGDDDGDEGPFNFVHCLPDPPGCDG